MKTLQNKKSSYGILNKIVSGRFLLTIVAGICFLMLANTLCTILLSKIKILKISDITSILTTMLLIISNVFTFYFLKSNLRNEDTSNQK